ncbi:hypothetical protein C9374_004892 [Naegleria lovaniensis]|uniref:Uncharacterized protein n=1 Tax=Naegleria lovaniensis TaxID=51637 RepID=A0AA88KKV0_NAELO|nr:uncharacterized protein C9374_004892 [Naegleria lovaniensis]KAG2382925.1 hypothetical protein C9374_004892 [Naegleria lovaniensis]
MQASNNSLNSSHFFNCFLSLNNTDDQEDFDGFDLLFGSGFSDEQSTSTYSTDSNQQCQLYPQVPQTPQTMMVSNQSNLMSSPSTQTYLSYPFGQQQTNFVDSNCMFSTSPLPPSQLQMSVSSGPFDRSEPLVYFEQQASTFTMLPGFQPPCNSIINQVSNANTCPPSGCNTALSEEELKSFIASECQKIIDRNWATLPPLKAQATKKRDKFDLETAIKKKLKN